MFGVSVTVELNFYFLLPFLCRLEGLNPYVIPVGGSNPLGCWGYIEAFREMMEQVSSNWDLGHQSITPAFLAYGCRVYLRTLMMLWWQQAVEGPSQDWPSVITSLGPGLGVVKRVLHAYCDMVDLTTCIKIVASSCASRFMYRGNTCI